MSSGADGRFSSDDIQTIWDAHREWCNKHAIEPDSPAAEDAAAAMLSMYKSGRIWKHELAAWLPDSGTNRETVSRSSESD